MNKLIDQIRNKLSNEFKPKSVEIIDNSHLHKGHKFNKENKLHLKLIIESLVLKKISTIDANRKIFSLLKKEIRENIHSLQIEIK